MPNICFLFCHGVGMCSVDPSCCSLYCCCSAWHLWSSACLRSADVSRGSSAGEVHPHASCLKGSLAPKSCFFPHVSLRCRRRNISDTLSQIPQVPTWPWRIWRIWTRILPACPLLFVSWRWSPIYRQTSLVFPHGRREEEEMIQQNNNIFYSDGKKLPKLPK